VREHRFFRIARASRLEAAMDEMLTERLQQQPITAHYHLVVNNNGNLLSRWSHPIANCRNSQGDRGAANNPDSAFVYGWPQCGQTALPSIRFFLQLGHATSFTFGRVARWTISPTTGTIQPRIVTN
jgi:hypothetical protein